MRNAMFSKLLWTHIRAVDLGPGGRKGPRLGAQSRGAGPRPEAAAPRGPAGQGVHQHWRSSGGKPRGWSRQERSTLRPALPPGGKPPRRIEPPKWGQGDVTFCGSPPQDGAQCLS